MTWKDRRRGWDRRLENIKYNAAIVSYTLDIATLYERKQKNNKKRELNTGSMSMLRTDGRELGVAKEKVTLEINTAYKRKADKVCPVDVNNKRREVPGGREDWYERSKARDMP